MIEGPQEAIRAGSDGFFAPDRHVFQENIHSGPGKRGSGIRNFRHILLEYGGKRIILRTRAYGHGGTQNPGIGMEIPALHHFSGEKFDTPL